MNNSLAQESYSITSINSLDTITLTGSYTDCQTMISNTSCVPASSTITISTGGVGHTIGGTGNPITYTSGSASSFIWKTPEEFVDTFPDYNRIQKMCEEYPGLKLAYEKFVTTYKLVKENYDTPEDKRPRS
jgi:hypothetical protein